MRVSASAGDFSVRAIAGTQVVLMAMDCPEPRRSGLLGFAIAKKRSDPESQFRWLRSLKVFRSVVPNPNVAPDPAKPEKRSVFLTRDHPVQSFLWSDYAADPDTTYTFKVVPMYGTPGALEPAEEIVFEITTEKERDAGSGVWFNRGAIASQAFAERFGNTPPEHIDDPEDPRVQWLSRGLLEACLAYIDAVPAGDGLRVAAYEFTYGPVLKALKAALDRGVDVRIIYHDTRKPKKNQPGVMVDGPNEKAIAASGLPAKVGNRLVLRPRAETKIPHNKFMVRLAGNTTAISVWTGSTNFTPSGFLGQTNVGHLLDQPVAAKQFLAFWKKLAPDPVKAEARAAAMGLTDDPAAVPPASPTTLVFSPRTNDQLLTWYGDRIEDAAEEVMFTSAFSLSPKLVPRLAKERDILRFILSERPPTIPVRAALDADRDVVVSYGTALGEMYEFKDGEPVARKRIAEFDLEKWFLVEEHFRPKNDGFVFFVHTKFLLIDPLSDDPLVCTGSANFSTNSLKENDENMLLIRGDTRVADIYLTEFDRLFRHFYARDIINELAAKGRKATKPFLGETSRWTKSSFTPGSFKTRRREMFFATPDTTWTKNAEARS